ncbi:MAG: ribulose-phosphate 3-epimerase [Pirellulaceae bacterium]
MSARERLRQLKGECPCVLPSMLMCDFTNLEREIRRLEDAGVKGLHLDVMDGQFVPNFTYGLTIVEAVRKLTDLPLDVHLMMNRAEEYLKSFAEAGSDIMTVHVEAISDVADTLGKIRGLGVASGLALNPSTSMESVIPFLDQCDLVLVMSVPAGFGGQSFHAEALARIASLREQGGKDLLIEVDGGVNSSTISRCVTAGADLLVVGSAIFRQESYQDAIRNLEGLVQQA